MTKDLAGARLSEADYLRLLEVCRDGQHFPADYAQWLALVAGAEKLAAAEGTPSPPITLEAEEFLIWCQAVNVFPCFEAMRAFMIVKRYGIEDGLDTIRGDL